MKVWICEPHPGNRRCDYYVEEYYTTFLDYLANTLCNFFDSQDDEQLAAGVTLTIRTTQMSQEDYEEITGGQP